MRCVTVGIHFVLIHSENKFAAQNVGSSMKSSVKNVSLRGEGEPLRYLQTALRSCLCSFSGGVDSKCSNGHYQVVTMVSF